MEIRSKNLRRLLSIWYIFIIWAVVAIIAVIFVFGMRTAYREHERLTVFIAAKDVQADGMRDKFMTVKPDYLFDVKINYCTALNNFNIYNASWIEATVLGSDIYVLPESKISDEACHAYFLPLTTEFVSANFGGVDVYESNDKIYGVRVYDKTVGASGNGEFITFTDGEFNENYYAFFGRHTVHLGQYVNTKYDAAIKFVSKLLITVEEK